MKMISMLSFLLPAPDSDLFLVGRIESRYLLILTENLSVLSIILDKFKSHDRQPEVVFGSKFREDVSYTQVLSMIRFNPNSFL